MERLWADLAVHDTALKQAGEELAKGRSFRLFRISKAAHSWGDVGLWVQMTLAFSGSDAPWLALLTIPVLAISPFIWLAGKLSNAARRWLAS